MEEFDWKMQNGESLRSYLYRIGKAKDAGDISMTWEQIAEILNEKTGNDWGEAAYRKKYSEGVAWRDEVFSSASGDEYIKEMRDERQKLYKERVLMRDERTELNKGLRLQARFEDIVNRMENHISSVGEKSLPVYYGAVKNGDRDFIVPITDWHIGKTFNNARGSFSRDVAEQRVAQYIDEIRKAVELYHPEDCYVALLGDQINGLIHKDMRITDRENVVEQVMAASDLIANFVYELSKDFKNVKVYSVGGNHSRLFPNKEECAPNELLDNIIPWYVKAKTSHIGNIEVINQEYESYVRMEVRGNVVIGVHGDKDGMSDASISKLIMWLNEVPAMIVMGHKHYSALTTYCDIPVVQCGSLCGSGDNLSTNYRLTGSGSQSIIVMNRDGMEALLPIVFR